jgi:hypothetical protein
MKKSLGNISHTLSLIYIASTVQGEEGEEGEGGDGRGGV